MSIPDRTLTERISIDGVTGTRQVPGPFLIEFSGCLLWFAWAVVLLALLLEIGGLARSRAARTIEGLRPLQQLHRRELEQLRQGIPLLGRRRSSPSLDQLLTKVDLPAFAESPEREATLPRVDGRTYEVTGFQTEEGVRLERETFWSIARDQLGDPLRWRQIAEANAALLEHHGRSVDDPGWPEEGWILVLPGGSDD